MPHIHEQIDFVVAIYIVHDNKVLLVNHPRYGRWIPPGGHIELHEHPDQTLMREVAEETGLTVKILADKPEGPSDNGHFLTSPNYVHMHDANSSHQHVALIYFAIADSPDFVLSDEHEDAKWVSKTDLDLPQYALTLDIKFLCKQALKAAKLDK